MRAAAAFDNRTGVTEPRTFARGFAANIGNHRFGDFSIDNKLREFFFL